MAPTWHGNTHTLKNYMGRHKTHTHTQVTHSWKQAHSSFTARVTDGRAVLLLPPGLGGTPPLLLAATMPAAGLRQAAGAAAAAAGGAAGVDAAAATSGTDLAGALLVAVLVSAVAGTTLPRALPAILLLLVVEGLPAARVTLYASRLERALKRDRSYCWLNSPRSKKLTPDLGERTMCMLRSPAAMASSQPLKGELRSITWIKQGGKLPLLRLLLLAYAYDRGCCGCCCWCCWRRRRSLQALSPILSTTPPSFREGATPAVSKARAV
jgi:hypothetical protein